MIKLFPCLGLFVLVVTLLLTTGCSVRLPKPKVVSGSPTSSNCVDDCVSMAQLDEEDDDSSTDDDDMDDWELEMDVEDMETDGRD